MDRRGGVEEACASSACGGGIGPASLLRHATTCGSGRTARRATMHGHGAAPAAWEHARPARSQGGTGAREPGGAGGASPARDGRDAVTVHADPAGGKRCRRSTALRRGHGVVDPLPSVAARWPWPPAMAGRGALSHRSGGVLAPARAWPALQCGMWPAATCSMRCAKAESFRDELIVVVEAGSHAEFVLHRCLSSAFHRTM
jgi:hypothetical protein